MFSHHHDRTTYPQDKRDEVIEFVLSGIAAFPGSEVGYFIDSLSPDRAGAYAARPEPRAAWSWRQFFSLGAVLRLT